MSKQGWILSILAGFGLLVWVFISTEFSYFTRTYESIQPGIELKGYLYFNHLIIYFPLILALLAGVILKKVKVAVLLVLSPFIGIAFFWSYQLVEGKFFRFEKSFNLIQNNPGQTVTFYDKHTEFGFVHTGVSYQTSKNVETLKEEYSYGLGSESYIVGEWSRYDELDGSQRISAPIDEGKLTIGELNFIEKQGRVTVFIEAR